MATGVILVAIGIGVGAVVLSNRSPATKPVVGLNGDPSLVGKWAVVLPSGLVLGISEPFQKYPVVGAPTFTVTVANYASAPIHVGAENFYALHGGHRGKIEDGEPSFGSHEVAPGSFRRGNITYYGSGIDKLVFEQGPYRAEIDMSRSDYRSISSVVRALRGPFR